MALEKLIADLIVSLDANTAALKAAKAAGAVPATSGNPAAATPDKPAAATPDKTKPAKALVIEFDVLKAAAMRVMDKHGQTYAKKLIADAGKSEQLAKVDKAHYAALFAAFEKALAPAPETVEEEPEPDEDDGL